MKSFKNYITEEPQDRDDALFVVVRNGRANLCSVSVTGPCSTFGNNVVNAVIQGENVIVTTADGKAMIYQINRTARTVVGPIKTV